MRKSIGALPSLYLRLLPRRAQLSSPPGSLTPRRQASSPWTAYPESSRPPSAATMAAGPFFTVAVSLLFPSPKTLIVPSVDAIFFNGDRVEGAGNPVIERLSNSRNVTELLGSKLGGSANAFLVDVSTFKGPFAVYKEFILSVNSEESRSVMIRRISGFVFHFGDLI